jgi:protocatechuate 3,4-dioxygenase beta subunit
MKASSGNKAFAAATDMSGHQAQDWINKPPPRPRYNSAGHLAIAGRKFFRHQNRLHPHSECGGVFGIGSSICGRQIFATVSSILRENMECSMNKIALGAIAVIIAAGAATYIAKPTGFGQVLTAAEKVNCGLTASVTEGPYFVSGTPELKDGNLNASNLPGTPLTISGHVYDGLDTSKPVANAVIEIWHADNSGSYHPNGNGDMSNYPAAEFALRGFIKTDAMGAYKFTTVYPGEYSGRTRHIHFKITADGKNSLTTQLIIPSLSGDKISFDEDTVSQGLPTCQLLKVDTAASPQTASFDFKL